MFLSQLPFINWLVNIFSGVSSDLPGVSPVAASRTSSSRTEQSATRLMGDRNRPSTSSRSSSALGGMSIRVARGELLDEAVPIDYPLTQRMTQSDMERHLINEAQLAADRLSVPRDSSPIPTHDSPIDMESSPRDPVQSLDGKFIIPCWFPLLLFHYRGISHQKEIFLAYIGSSFFLRSSCRFAIFASLSCCTLS